MIKWTRTQVKDVLAQDADTGIKVDRALAHDWLEMDDRIKELELMIRKLKHQIRGLEIDREHWND